MSETPLSDANVGTYARTLLQVRKALRTAEETNDEGATDSLKGVEESHPYNDPRVIEAARRLAVERGEGS